MKRLGIANYLLSYVGMDLSLADKVARNMHVTEETLNKYGKYVDPNRLPKEFKTEDYSAPSSGGDVDKSLAALLEPAVLDPYTCPLMADSVANVPEALVMTLGTDTLRDDGLLYFVRLREDGVRADLYHDDNGWHGSIGNSVGPGRFECGARILARVIEYVRQRI